MSDIPDNYCSESNIEIWSAPNTAKSLGYDKVEYPLAPLIKGSNTLLAIKDFIKKLSPEKEISILDIAGGNGRKYHYLKKVLFKDAPFNYTAIDMNPLCIQAGKNHFKNNTKVKFIQANIDDYKFGTNKYDICILDSALCYVSNPWQILIDVYKISNSLLLLRTDIAIPQTLKLTKTGLEEKDFNFVSDENFYSVLEKPAPWGGGNGASYIFPPELYGLLFDHPDTKELSCHFEFNPIIMQNELSFPPGHKRGLSWKKQFQLDYISNTRSFLQKCLFLNNEETSGFMKNHSSANFTSAQAEFFVEIRQ
jgi:hypothetical protein